MFAKQRLIMDNAISLELDFGSSKICYGRGLSSLPELLVGRSHILFTDSLLAELYRDELQPYDVVTLPRGEELKTLAQVEHYLGHMLDQDISRKDVVISFGGGAVSDFVGFMASIYKRGIEFISVPTTVLAQVDAALGGKTGVNFGQWKNMVGSFYMPSHILIDSHYCLTQDHDDYKQGFAEIIKHAAIRDLALFEKLEKDCVKLMAKQPEVLEDVIRSAGRIKLDIVAKDAKEAGLRKLLNFGHTVGHGIEKLAGMAHGDAIGVGMSVAAALSQSRCQLSPEAYTRLIDLIGNFDLETVMSQDIEEYWPLLLKDKKAHANAVDYVFLTDIGKAIIEPIALDQLRSLLEDYHASI